MWIQHAFINMNAQYSLGFMAPYIWKKCVYLYIIRKILNSCVLRHVSQLQYFGGKDRRILSLKAALTIDWMTQKPNNTIKINNEQKATGKSVW